MSSPTLAFVTRFAPSPTGRLHLGHAYSALLAFDAARAAGGRFILRIEDIDRTRCRPAFEAAIYEDLAWLGLDWETPVRRQSDHFDDYAQSLERLKALGVVYRCFRTRAEVLDAIASAPHGPGEAGRGDTGSDPVYRGPETPMSEAEQAERLARGEPFAWRLSMARARATLGEAWRDLAFIEEGSGPGGETGRIPADPARLGDVVLARKDVGVSYHLAVVHDDGLQGVTHVIRAQDLHDAAHLHALLQNLLGLPTPRYRHHGLILGADGKRLAKRDSAKTLAEWRASGASPAEVRARLGL